jgi:pyruvate/2-oxoglutarate/acetoin dehydrogenase E1 component
MEFSEAWERLDHITLEEAEAIKQIGGALSTRVTVRTTAGGGTVVTAERFTETAAILTCADPYWTA